MKLLSDSGLERSLQDYICDLKLAGAIRRNVYEMDARIVLCDPVTEFLRDMYTPYVQYQYDVIARAEVVQEDLAIGVRDQHFGHPLSHGLDVGSCLHGLARRLRFTCRS